MLLYLAAAGVGHLRVIDFDHVELSNLNRQILFTLDDLGRNKAAAARQRLARLNDQITIEAVQERVGEGNIAALLAGFDVVVEGGDSLAGRLLVNAYCLQAGVLMVHLVTGTGRPITDGYLAFSAFQGAFDFVPTPRQPDCAACAQYAPAR